MRTHARHGKLLKGRRGAGNKVQYVVLPMPEKEDHLVAGAAASLASGGRVGSQLTNQAITLVEKCACSSRLDRDASPCSRNHELENFGDSL